MGALQESRFALIIGVILLVGILAAFFLMQNNVGYTDFSTNLKTSYAETKANAGSIKTLADVVSVDGVNFRQMKNNQLFGYTLSGTTADIPLLDGYTGATSALTISGATAPAGKIGVAFLLSDDSTLVKNADGTGSGSITALGAVGALSTAAGTDSVARGWNLDGGGYVLYTFKTAAIAKDVLNNYIPTGTLVGTSSIVAPFSAR